MLSKSFKAGKCKTSLKLAMARIKLLKNKREDQVKKMRRELAQLLEAGQEQTARIRVEHVIREEKTMSAYELIDIYCELIVARLPIIEAQKSCPIDLKEAISSVVFASPRCADIPELMDARKNFAAKYGKEFITSALEIRPDCGVNRMMVEKLSAAAPDLETKLKTLTAIAQEHNVKWDSKAFEEQLRKPIADLLNGPNSFASASKIPMESSDVKISSTHSQKNESTTKLFQTDLTSKPTSMDNFSQTNISTPSTSVSSTSQNESRVADSRLVREVKNAYSREEDASLNQPTWKMEFKDATSAAQAAAESAERASMAARAAAELARHGNFSRQSSSTGSHESPKYGMENDKRDELKGSKRDSVTKEDNEVRRSHGMKPEVQNLQRDEVMQGGTRRETGSIAGGYASFRKSLSRSPSHSSGTSVNDDVSEINLHEDDMKAYDHDQINRKESVEKDFKIKENEDVELDWWNKNEDYNKSASFHRTRSTFDDDIKWNSNIQKHENDGGEASTRMGAREGIYGGDEKQPIPSDYSAVVFDDYGSDADDISIFGSHNEEHMSHSFLPNQGEERSSFPSDVDLLSLKQHRHGSLVKDGSSQLRFMTEPHPTEHSETLGNEILPSQSHDSLPATFDDSDGLSSESEDTVANSTHKARKPSRLLREQSSSRRGSLSEGSGRRLSSSSFKGTKVEEEVNRNILSPVSSSPYEESHEPEPKSVDKISKRSGSGDLHNTQPSSRSDKTCKNLINSERDSYQCPSDEEPQRWQSSEVPAAEEAETKEKFEMTSLPSDFKYTEISDEVSFERGQELNLGRLTGGLKNRGYIRPPYVKSPLVDSSLLSEQPSNGTFIIEKPIVSHQDKSSANFEFPDRDRYARRVTVEDDTSKSRISKTYVEPDFDKPERLVSRDTFGRRRGYRGEASLSSSDKIAEVIPRIGERPIVSYQDEIFEDREIQDPESDNQRSHRKGYNESKSSNSSVDSIEQRRHTVGSRRSRGTTSVPPNQSTESSPDMDPNKTLASSEVPKVESYGQRPLGKAYKELSSKVPIAYFDPVDDESEELARGHSVGNRASKDVKLSRRTRDLPPEAKKGSHSRFTGHSDVPSKADKPSQESSPASEPLSKTKTNATNLEGKKSSKYVQPNSSAGQPSAAPATSESSEYRNSPKSSKHDSIEFVAPANDGDSAASSSSKGLTSRESSLKNASHVHPKLPPDYETFAAHFQSLRSNIR